MASDLLTRRSRGQIFPYYSGFAKKLHDKFKMTNLNQRFRMLPFMPLLPRAAFWLATIQSEFKKRDRAIEQDTETTKVTVELILGKRTGDPVKIRYLTSSETDLTQLPARAAI
jgi:hypothetical protein